VITPQKIADGTTGMVAPEFPVLRVRTGKYFVYGRISDPGGARILSKPTLSARDLPLPAAAPNLDSQGENGL